MSHSTLDIVRISYCGKELAYYVPHIEDHIQQMVGRGRRVYEEDILIDVLSRELAPGLVVDVGANIGNHTVFLAKLLERHVVALEPYEKAFRVLEKNVVLNELSDMVTLVPKAAGRLAGRANLEQPPENNWGQAKVELADQGAVEVVRLDDLEIAEPVALVKIDVEGMELDVVEGAGRLLERNRPMLYIEAQTPLQYAALRRRLRALDYHMIRRFNHTPTYVFVSCRTERDQITALLEKTEALASLEEFAIANRETSRALGQRERALQNFVKTNLLSAIEKQFQTIDKQARTAADKDSKRVLAELDATRKHLNDELTRQANENRETMSRLERMMTEAVEKIKKSFAEEIRSRMSETVRHAPVKIGSDKRTVLPGVHQEDGASAGVKLAVPICGASIEIRLPGQGVGEKSAHQVTRSNVAGTSVTQNRASILARASHSASPLEFQEAESDKISVIMTAYNSAAYIQTAVRNVLAQTHTDVELIIVDDASTDSTFEIVDELARGDARIRPIRMYKNRGTYWCKNFGITQSTGRYVTFQDSDDTSDIDRLRLQLQELQRTRAVMCTCNYVRVNPEGQVVLNRGRAERKAIMAAMLDKNEIIRHVGYFDSVRTSADDEFNRRVGIAFGQERICHIAQPLYRATVRDGSLTNAAQTKADIAAHNLSPGDRSFLSAPRREYVRQYTAWHERLKIGAEKPLIQFPQLRRSFPAPALLLAEPHQQESYVTASMASFPAREALLAQTVDSILPQVDVLNVYLNGYERTPGFLRGPKIHVIHSREYGDLRDNGKFFFLDSVLWGYHFTIDDDIVYPPDYVQKTILKIEQYNRQAIVGCHGVILADPFIQFMEGRKVFHFKRKLERDTLVNLLGTGTVAYHTSTIQLSLADFEHPGMADVWLAIAAKRQNVPMIAIERAGEWLLPLAEADETSLYSAATRDDEIQTLAIKNEGLWRLDCVSYSVPWSATFTGRFSNENVDASESILEPCI